MHQTRRALAAWSILVSIALVLAACGGGATPTAPTAAPQPTASQPTVAAQPTAIPQPTAAPRPTDAPVKTEPVVLKVGWTGTPDTLNPAYAVLSEAYTVFDLTYSTLLREDPTSGKHVGNLAKEWKISDDGLTWTFTLQDNIKWHDGTPFTADDVAWSMNAIIKDPTGWSTESNYTIGFKEAKALDPKTVQLTLDNPIGNMEDRLSAVYTVYRKDFENFKTAEELQNFGNDKLIGTGPFKLNTFEKDKGILILDANPDYFNGRPKIDQIIFQTFDNEDAMVQALKVGDIDMMTQVPSAAYNTVKGFDNVKTLESPGRSFSELIINSVPATHTPKPKRNPAVTDPKVREAIATAINKQDLVDIVLQGLGQPGAGIMPPALNGGFWFNSDLKNPDFDLAKANQILEDAGYKKGADGIRAKGNDRLEMRLQFPNNRPNYPRIADLISGWLNEIGIKATPEAADPDALTAAVTPTGDYDLVIWGWGVTDSDFGLSVLTTDQFVSGGWSDSGYSNPKYDDLYKQQQKLVDQNARQKTIKDMQQLVFDDKPYIVLYYDDNLQAYRTDRFKNFIESPLGIEIAESLMQVEPVQ